MGIRAKVQTGRWFSSRFEGPGEQPEGLNCDEAVEGRGGDGCSP